LGRRSSRESGAFGDEEVATDHFVDDQAEELLAEGGVDAGIGGRGADPGHQLGLASVVGGGEAVGGFVEADEIGDFEALGEETDEVSIDLVDTRPELGECFVAHR